VRGVLDGGAEGVMANARQVQLTLEPGEMRILPVTLSVSGAAFAARDWAVTFTPEDRKTQGVFRTELYPLPPSTDRRVLQVLNPAEAGTKNARMMAHRPLATNEPPESIAGGWGTTRAVGVTGKGGTWTFTISQLPAEPTRPAVVELILPDNFHLPAFSFLNLEYRMETGGTVPADATATTFGGKSGVLKNSISIAWRTANGNLYTVWRPPSARLEWQRYAQMKESFSMGFYGRAAAPWRFEENRPVALVFMILPERLPARFELRKMEVVGY
jgi:hypothetical protein